MKEAFNYKRLTLYVFVAIISVCNLVFLYQKTAAYILCAIELAILLYIFVFGNEVDYFCCYLIFLCLSFEFAQFVQNKQIYNFRNLRVLGINMSLWALCPLYLKFLLSKKLKISNWLKTGATVFLSLQFVSLVTGSLAVFAFNDNNMSAIDNVYRLFFSEFAFYTFFTFGIIIGCFFAVSSQDGAVKLKNCLYLIIFGCCAQAVFSRLFSLYSWYGEIPMLLVSNISFIFPLFLLLPLYDWKNFPKFLTVLVVATNVLLLLYNANGKVYLYFFIVAIIYFVKLIKLAAHDKRFIWLITGLILLCLLAVILFSVLRDRFTLLSYKFDQAIQLINIFDKNWFKNMADSPKTRIVEFLCVGKEYLNKPQYLLFGKGYLGSIKDYMGFFAGKIDNSLFSAEEFKINSFYNVHESVNVIFLQNGIVGLGLWAYLVVAGLFKKSRNAFVMIGTVWLLSNYGYSNCISAISLCFLIVGWNDYFARKREICVKEAAKNTRRVRAHVLSDISKRL